MAYYDRPCAVPATFRIRARCRRGAAHPHRVTDVSPDNARSSPARRRSAQPLACPRHGALERQRRVNTRALPWPAARELARRTLPALATLAVGMLGVQVFVALDLPMPWLLGAILATLLLTRAQRLPVTRPKPLINPMRAVLGLAIGSAFTPALVDEIGEYVLSLSLVVPHVALVAACGVFYYARVLRYDRPTAFFCSLPGGLVEMTILGEEMGAQVNRVMLTQTTRVLLIVYTVPFLIEWQAGVDLGGRQSITAPLATVNPADMLILALLAAAGWWGARKLRISGATIIGPMILSATAYLLGWVESRPPDELLKAAQLVLGTAIGCAFVGVGLRAMMLTIVQTLGYFAILIVTTLAFASLAQHLTGFPLAAALLAFSPGGQAEMNVMALIMGAFVPYVALHHVLRLALVMAVAPQVMKRFLRD